MELNNYNFGGFFRKNNLVGIRNYIAVIPTVGCVNEVAKRIAFNTKIVQPFLHHQGCCQLSPDLNTVTRVLKGIGNNPNVGAVLLVSLGCESVSAEEIREVIGKNKPVESVRLQEIGGITKTVKEGKRIVKKLANELELKRDNVSLDKLSVGIKCGASDATSGLASNPAVGQAVDILIENGATVIFGETTEVLGAEHILSRRAINKLVGEKILNKVNMMEKRANACGVDMRGGQPTAGNIRGGITTIEEKSLGAIVKSGTKSINDVLEYGEAPKEKGLYFMDSPGREMEFLTGVVAAGCQIILFTTGIGAPQGFPFVPVIKITGNKKTYQHLIEHMDVNVSKIIEGGESIQEAGKKIVEKIIEISSGIKTKSELSGYDSSGLNANIYVTGPVI